MIFVQTVLEEVKNRNPATYNRARAIIADPAKQSYAFTNEHHRYV